MSWARVSDVCIESNGYVISKARTVRDGVVVWLYRAWPPGVGMEYVQPLCESTEADPCKAACQLHAEQSAPKRGRK